MTYCLGILLPQGLVLASDSRSNAGVDQIARVYKLDVLPAKDRVIVIQVAGNLATTQAVVTSLREALGCGKRERDLQGAPTMFEVAKIVGDELRDTVRRDGKFVEAYGDASASFLVSGQIAGEPPRLFEVYSAGNFIEATERSPFVQIGEAKYGKPILDRALTRQSTLEEAAKLALLSFDAAVRSNLSVGLPIDLLLYRAGSFSTANRVTIDEDDPYWNALRQGYSAGLAALISDLPTPPAAWLPAPEA
jgi:putative proteasome-type protease